MKLVRRLFSYLIMLFSEALWMYYTIIFFTGNEWEQFPVFDVSWWLIAGLAGYLFNILVAGRVHYSVLLFGNMLIFSAILFQNWKLNSADITLGLGIALSIAISVLFIHSATFAFQEPSRSKMLGHFEGNIVLYMVYTLLFMASDWFTGAFVFHFLFAVAITMSLVGMIFTLQSFEKKDEQQKIEIHKVGQSGWFAGVMSLLLASIAFICLLLFIPVVRTGLYHLVLNSWEGLKWLGRAFAALLGLLARLLPASDSGGELPPPAEEPFSLPEGANEETFVSLPLVWIIAMIAVVVIGIAIWVISKWLKHRKFTPSIKVQNLVIARGSWWKAVRRKMTALVRRLILTWRMRFPHFYHSPVYWYFYQLTKWGKKNGIPRLKHETSKEYVEKISEYLREQPSTFTYKDKKYEVKQLLTRLNQAYQSTYYGTETADVAVDEFAPLIKYLKTMRKKSKKTHIEDYSSF